MEKSLLIITQNTDAAEKISSKAKRCFKTQTLTYSQTLKIKTTEKITAVIIDSNVNDFFTVQTVAAFFYKFYPDTKIFIYNFITNQEELLLNLNFLNQEENVKKSNLTYKELIEKACKNESTILLTGESGVGKSYTAQYIHQHSKLAGFNYMPKNITDFAPSLIESELFGSENGAFTGAISKPGILDYSKNGTLLIDEIGEASLELQNKFLGVLDSGKYHRVGSCRTEYFNGRFIFATNQNLHDLIQLKKFSESFFYRISVFPILIPPLRERMDELEQLILDFTQNFKVKIQTSAVSKLEKYNWPGNIRQLKNVVERASILCDNKTITRNDIIFD